MQKVMAYLHSQEINGKRVRQDEVEIVDSKFNDGVKTYIVKTTAGIYCTAIFNILTNSYYVDDVYGVIPKPQSSTEL